MKPPAGWCPVTRSISQSAFPPGFLLASLLLVTACAGDRDTSRKVVRLTTVDYAFQAPDTIDEGFTTFELQNRGSQLHMAQLIKLEGGRTLDEFLAAYDEAFRTNGPRPDWALRFGGPGAADPDGASNATQSLDPGRYAWICIMNVPDGIPHVVKARMAKAFVVRARGSEVQAQAAPQANVVIQLSDYAFTLSTPLSVGRHMIRVENSGAEPHEVGLVRLAEGKTKQDFDEWTRNPQGAPPVTVVGGVSSLAPDVQAFFEVELTPGDYILFCFVTAPDGRPHTEHGMIEHLRVG